MQILTLTSDYGIKDQYIAVIKAIILSKVKQKIQFIDITHSLKKFDIIQAAYVVKNSYKFFPENTIHLILVNSSSEIQSNYIFAKYKNHFFLAPNNGVLTLIIDEKEIKANLINFDNNSNTGTFEFIGKPLEFLCDFLNNKQTFQFDNTIDDMVFKSYPSIIKKDNLLQGKIIHIDDYGNLITNINYKLFENARKKRRFRILFQKYKIENLSKNYFDLAPGNILALFNSYGLLEIAVSFGNASTLFNPKSYDEVLIEFL